MKLGNSSLSFTITGSELRYDFSKFKFSRNLNLLHEYKKALEKKNNLAIMLSGGIDSASVAYTCVKFNISAEYYFFAMYYNDVFVNRNDYKNVVKFASKHNININILSVNIDKFLNTQLHEYAKKYSCNSPQVCCHLYFADLVDKNKTIVFGGDTYVVYNEGHSFGLSKKPIRSIAYEMYAQKNKNKSVIPSMLSHTDEIISCFLDFFSKPNAVPFLVKPLAKYTDINRYKLKTAIFKYYNFDFQYALHKQTGFEVLREIVSKEVNEYPKIREFDKRYRWNLMHYAPRIIKISKSQHIEVYISELNEKYSNFLS